VRINSCVQGSHFFQPDGIGNGQVVACANDMTGAEDGAILAFAILFAYPPPKVFRMN